MTTFTATSPIPGTTDGVLDFATSVLANNGFAITHRDAHAVSLTGPGLNSTRQNPLLGASRITLAIRGNSIDADAELGGVDSMRRFVTWFPLSLGLGLGLFFAIGGGFLFGNQFGVGFGMPWAAGWRWFVVAMGMALLPVSPWLFLSPMIARMIRKRTESAIQVLIRNAGMCGRPA